MTVDEGSYFFSFGSGDGADDYPTNGVGGSGTGTIADSHMADFSLCVLDAIQIATNGGGSSSAAFQVRRASNNALILGITLQEAENPVGKIIPLGLKIRDLGGFTIRSSDVSVLTGIATYRRIFRRASSI